MKRLLLSTLAVSLLAGCANENNEEVVEKEAPKTEVEEVKVSPEKKLENDTRHDIGEVVTIDGIDFTVKSSQLTDERIEDHFESFEYVLELELYYKNNTEQPFPAGRDVSVQVNDKEATYNELDVTKIRELAPDEEIKGKVNYAINETTEELTTKLETLLNTQNENEEYKIYPDLDIENE